MAKAAPVKRGKSRNTHKQYDGGKLKNKNCPKCGPGYSLAAHKNRTHCGKCGYSEVTKA